MLKKRWANAEDVAIAAREIIDSFLQANQASEIKIIETLDSTVAIDDNIGVLTTSLILSIVLVMSLLFLFLTHRGKKMTALGIVISLVACGVVIFVPQQMASAVALGVLTLFVLATCRAALLTVSGIVFSFLGALLVFYLAEYSLNEISLLGFVLVSGIVVDDAIVVLENIQRRREQGEDMYQAVINGTAEVLAGCIGIVDDHRCIHADADHDWVGWRFLRVNACKLFLSV